MTMQNNYTDMTYFNGRMFLSSRFVLTVWRSCLFYFLQVHSLTTVTIVYTTARCVALLKLPMYENFIYPLLRYDLKAEM